MPVLNKIALVAVWLLSPLVWAQAPATLHNYQTRWAQIKYQLDEDGQEAAFAVLADDIRQLAKQYPDNADVLIWKGIITSSYAGAKGGLGALSLVDESRAALQDALARDPEALDGSAYTSLGVLYYQVPGWPLSFGDDDEAEKLLKNALRINPDGIDANYFYADFRYAQGDYAQAMIYANKALQAPARPTRPLADVGRREEISALIKKIEASL